ncbi:MAG: hypothetical protein ACLPVF_09215 [Acidimicrobiales bacterium]
MARPRRRATLWAVLALVAAGLVILWSRAPRRGDAAFDDEPSTWLARPRPHLQPDEQPDEQPDRQPAPPPDAGKPPVYRHGTCPVHHRSPEAAARCRRTS